MTKKGGFRDDDKALLTALFRYSVIGPLLDDHEGKSLRTRVAEQAATPHYHPTEGAVAVRERTLWSWLSTYRAHGIEGLRPRRRSDHGTTRALTPAVLERAEALRRELPSRWTSTLLDILVREGLVARDEAPHRATLDRHLQRQGASRRQLRVLGTQRTIKMQFASFGELWVGDYKHGPQVRMPDGTLGIAKLGAFIDHCKRYPVADRWYPHEDRTSLRDTLLRALLRWKAPKVVYVDRGGVYRAEQLAYSLAAVGTRLVHSRAYYSQGRGVIERWWQLADAFIAEVEARNELLTIHELNRLWEAFRTLRYLEVEHSEFGCTPAQAMADVVPQPIDPAVARELFLVRAEREVHRKDGCVSVEGKRFLCDASLRGRKVVVRYDPRDLSHVLVFVDGVRVGRAMPQPIGRVDEEARRAAPTGPTTDYLALLRADYDARLAEQARPLAYSDLTSLDPSFDESRFLEVLAALTDARVRGAEAAEAHAFWKTFGPLPEKLVRSALEHAVRLRGTGRHVRVYLAVLRTFVLARMTSLSPENNHD